MGWWSARALRVLGLMGLFAVCASIWSLPGWAEPADASKVVGSYTIRSFSPGTAGPDPKTCWGDLAVGDVVTVAEAGSGMLLLSWPTGLSWQLEPAPNKDPDPSVQSSWTTTMEHYRAKSESLNLDYTSYLIYVDVEKGLNSPAAYCSASLVAEAAYGPVDDPPSSDPIAWVKDTNTLRWVPWIFVPVLGWVIYKVAKKSGKKSNNQRDNQRKEYFLDVGTQDNRTSLNADGEDLLWVYAQVRCNRPEVNTASITAALTFATEGVDAPWLLLGPPAMANGFKNVPVRAWPPSPDADPQEGNATVVVWTYLEGRPLSARVTLDVQAFALRIY